MSIQILQYEFLGPVRLSDWGPPMEKTLYLVMSRDGDRFGIVYAGDCERTEKGDFFTQNDLFKCWTKNAGGEQNLHLAILPMFDSEPAERKGVLDRIVSRYDPACNQ